MRRSHQSTVCNSPCKQEEENLNFYSNLSSVVFPSTCVSRHPLHIKIASVFLLFTWQSFHDLLTRWLWGLRLAAEPKTKFKLGALEVFLDEKSSCPNLTVLLKDDLMKRYPPLNNKPVLLLVLRWMCMSPLFTFQHNISVQKQTKGLISSTETTLQRQKNPALSSVLALNQSRKV